jgi:uncharacterized protein
VDRIDPLTGAPLPHYRPDKKKVGRKEALKGDFTSFVNESRLEAVDIPEEISESDLEEILDGIHQAGEELAEDPGMQKVLVYKRRVQAFLSYVVKRSRRVDHQEGTRLSMFKQPKRYTLITVVDRRLEQLAAGILQNQTDKLEILRKVEEIQGMLVDLTG